MFWDFGCLNKGLLDNKGGYYYGILNSFGSLIESEVFSMIEFLDASKGNMLSFN